MKQYKIGEVEMRFAEIIWRLEPVSLEELAEAVRRELGWKKSETERMVKQLCEKGIFVVERDLLAARVSRNAFRQERSEEAEEGSVGEAEGSRGEKRSGSLSGRAGKRFKKSSVGFPYSFWAPMAFEEGDAVRRIKNIMKYRKTFAALAVCAVVVCILGGALFLTKAGKKEFSFQNLKREEIQKVEFNTREDFYYTFDEEETDVLCRMLQKIVYEDSGTEAVGQADGAKFRLTLTDGEAIAFSCSGHTIQIQDKSYYVEGDVLDRLRYKCEKKWIELRSANERRQDFYDLYEATVRDVKVYDGISLCYTLNEKEREETLQAIRDLGSFGNHYVREEDETQEWYGRRKKRFLVEKEDGVQVEFYVNQQRVYVNEQMFSIPEEKGNALKERQDAWLQALREKTRQTPFTEVSSEKIASVSVFDHMMGRIRELSAEEREELLATLQDLVLVGTGTKDYVGLEGLLTEAFQIEDAEGNVFTISANEDPFIVNGQGYCIENTDKAEKLMELYELWGKRDMEEPVVNQEVYGNEFRLSIYSAQPWYLTERLTKTALFTLELEYIGAEEEIQLWHGDPMASIDIETEDGRSIFGFYRYDVLRSSILKKGEPYRLELDGERLGKWLKMLEEEGGASFTDGKLSDGYAGDVFENGSLKPGRYRAVAHAEFSTDGEQVTESGQNLELSVEFKIE